MRTAAKRGISDREGAKALGIKATNWTAVDWQLRGRYGTAPALAIDNLIGFGAKVAG
jgi:hypothetical protein